MVVRRPALGLIKLNGNMNALGVEASKLAVDIGEFGDALSRLCGRTLESYASGRIGGDGAVGRVEEVVKRAAKGVERGFVQQILVGAEQRVCAASGMCRMRPLCR